MNEQMLWEKYTNNKTIQNRNDLIIHYYDWVVKLINICYKRYTIQYMDEDLDDLVSYGILGLVTAIERFEEDQSTAFKTYAYYRIKGNVIDEIRKFQFGPYKYRSKIDVASLNITIKSPDEDGKAEAMDLLESNYDGPCDQFLEKELKNDLDNAIEQLPETQRNVIKLTCYGRKPGRITSILGITYHQYHTLKVKALLFLRKRISRGYLEN